MSALCQKQTFRPLLDIIDGGQGCSSSWSITHETSPSKIPASDGGTAALSVGTRFAWAQTYPSRPVRVVVGFPPGTSSDITARLIGQWLSERLGQQFIVENRPGAGTNIAAETVVHATPDGYTLLWVTQTNAINVTLYDAH
jgi:tripartite-type tricarboxylate transporter receptor subunit TctC